MIRFNCCLLVEGESSVLDKFTRDAEGVYPGYASSGCVSCRIQGGPECSPEYALSFHSLVPIPDEKLQGGWTRAGEYWEIANWGAKGGATDIQRTRISDSRLMYTFTTEGALPKEVFRRASETCSDIRFILAGYSEETGLPGDFYEFIQGESRFLEERSCSSIDDLCSRVLETDQPSVSA